MPGILQLLAALANYKTQNNTAAVYCSFISFLCAV